MLRPGVRNAAAIAVLVAAQGCDSMVEPKRCALPEFASTTVAAVPGNVLGALVTLQVRTADSAAVRYGRSDGPLDPSTPTAQVEGDTAQLAVLGLNESTEYEIEPLAFNKCGMQKGRPITFSSGALPADLPRYDAWGSDPSPGYVAFAAGNYGIVIDNTGTIVWYHHFPNGPGLNFQAQKNGRYVARPTPPAGEAPQWIEIDVLGNVTRTLACGNGKQARMHDILVKQDGSYWLLCDELRTLDLTAQGRRDAAVTGTAIQHVSASGDVLFDWSPFDHMQVDISVLRPADLSGRTINWTHGNALDLDADGNLLVSFRNLDELVKIDSGTGEILWRMGGARNDFTLENTDSPPFRGQHSVRSIRRGELHLLDNLGQAGASRVERYEYDEVSRVARLVASHTSSTGAIAQTGGTVQRLPGDRTLVSFGSGGNVEEVDAAGRVVWRINGNPGYVFRAQRINSLYEPGATGEDR